MTSHRFNLYCFSLKSGVAITIATLTRRKLKSGGKPENLLRSLRNGPRISSVRPKVTSGGESVFGRRRGRVLCEELDPQMNYVESLSMSLSMSMSMNMGLCLPRGIRCTRQGNKVRQGHVATFRKVFESRREVLKEWHKSCDSLG